MALNDIHATEKRGMWSPPNGAHPQQIPDRWRNYPGEPLIFDLPDRTDDELRSMGWKGPFQTPTVNYFTHYHQWNEETREFEIIELDISEKKNRVDYQDFCNKFFDTNVYTTLKRAASTTLSVNVSYTEFIALLDDAKRGHANVSKLQAVISEILAGVTFSTDELSELQTLFDSTGMSGVYNLS
tara:strand:+ start:1661 stop:2212 length:552 start_codon:yes stop_codon:yes gene_type:complete